MDKIIVSSHAREELIDITDRIQEKVEHHRLGEGIVVVFVPHTTAGITINEGADPAVAADLLSHLQKLVPRESPFRHREGNSDAHVKASLLGSSVSVPVHHGRLQLGTWQHIFFFEGDGPRTRYVYLSLISQM
ncbi:MAG: secondary thiamine-phosphate synthase enzyme YjbQ [Candidatus Thermoplasmatota archaeon]